MTAGDRAGKSHWDNTWEGKTVPRFEDLYATGRWNHVNRQFAKFLANWLTPQGTAQQLIELGCARSIWLPFFARQLGYQVTGLDYSEQGCELARASLRNAGVTGEIVNADFFAPPLSLLGKFDAAVSFGVAEHFDDTAGCIRRFADFVRPGGRVVTLVPNMTGLPGYLQRRLNGPVFDKHVPLRVTHLEEAHRGAGLHVKGAGYLISTNFGILNLEGIDPATLRFVAKRVLVAALARVSLVGWLAEPYLPTTALTAAYVYCVADRPAAVQ